MINGQRPGNEPGSSPNGTTSPAPVFIPARLSGNGSRTIRGGRADELSPAPRRGPFLVTKVSWCRRYFMLIEPKHENYISGGRPRSRGRPRKARRYAAR